MPPRLTTNLGPARWKSQVLPPTPGNRTMTKNQKAAFVARMKAARNKSARAKQPTKAKVTKAAKPRTARRAARRSVAKSASKPTAAVVTSTTTTRTVSRRRNPGLRAIRAGAGLRLPWSGLADLPADIAALPAALMPVKGDKSDSMIIAVGTIGAGFVGTAVLGAVAAPLVARILPPVSPTAGRMVNSAVYLVSGVVPSLCVGNARIRRRLMAGAVGLAISEAIMPGWSSDVMRSIPGVGALIPDAPKATKPKATTSASTKSLKGLEDDLMLLTQDSGTPSADLTRPGSLAALRDDAQMGNGETGAVDLPAPVYADLNRPGSLADLGDLVIPPKPKYADLNRPGALA
jgi:hypothetical protein